MVNTFICKTINCRFTCNATTIGLVFKVNNHNYLDLLIFENLNIKNISHFVLLKIKSKIPYN